MIGPQPCNYIFKYLGFWVLKASPALLYAYLEFSWKARPVAVAQNFAGLWLYSLGPGALEIEQDAHLSIWNMPSGRAFKSALFLFHSSSVH